MEQKIYDSPTKSPVIQEIIMVLVVTLAIVILEMQIREDDYMIYTLEELMPFGFSGKNLS